MTIPKGETAYATNKGLYYIRAGSTKQIPDQYELLRLFQKKNIIQFDETPVLKASIDSLNISKVDKYLQRLELSPMDEANLKQELINLSILCHYDEQYYPTLAGFLTFARQPQQYFPSYSIRCGAYHGTDLTSETIRETDLTGTFDEIIEDAVSFCKLTIPQTKELENDIQYKVNYLYPIMALREAIVNAVCHRDYTIVGSSIRIFVFSDRIEIRSPGGLANTLSIENMLYRQYLRNQMIASFLSGYSYMERRGKGLMKIKKVCSNSNIDCRFYVPNDNNEFVVIMKKNLKS